MAGRSGPKNSGCVRNKASTPATNPAMIVSHTKNCFRSMDMYPVQDGRSFRRLRKWHPVRWHDLPLPWRLDRASIIKPVIRPDHTLGDVTADPDRRISFRQVE